MVVPPYLRRERGFPNWLRGSEDGNCTLHVSCTLSMTNIYRPSEGIGRENGGLDKLRKCM